MQGLFFEDLRLGLSAEITRVVEADDLTAFAAVSGDTNPVHLNEEFAGGTLFKGRIAHGMLTASLISTVIGTKLPGSGCIYVSQSLRFLQPVRSGDTVTAIVTVKEVDVERKRIVMTTACKVQGKDVLTGEAVVMVPRRPAPQT